jgi:hypothetical protein
VADLFAVKELLGHKDVKNGAEGQKKIVFELFVHQGLFSCRAVQ